MAHFGCYTSTLIIPKNQVASWSSNHKHYYPNTIKLWASKNNAKITPNIDPIYSWRLAI